jgi:hypothetical protein
MVARVFPDGQSVDGQPQELTAKDGRHGVDPRCSLRAITTRPSWASARNRAPTMVCLNWRSRPIPEEAKMEESVRSSWPLRIPSTENASAGRTGRSQAGTAWEPCVCSPVQSGQMTSRTASRTAAPDALAANSAQRWRRRRHRTCWAHQKRGDADNRQSPFNPHCRLAPRGRRQRPAPSLIDRSANGRS